MHIPQENAYDTMFANPYHIMVALKDFSLDEN